jgi:hypothetical protein
MISPAGREKIAGSLKTLSIIWTAMMGTVILIGGVNIVLYKKGILPLVPNVDEVTQMILLAVLSFLAISEIGGIVLFSVMFKGESIIKKRLEAAPPSAVDQGASNSLLTPKDRLALALTPLYFSLSVIRWALGLSVSFYGFILALATGFMDVAVVFHTISLVIIAFLKPDTAEINVMAEKALAINKDLS